MNSLTLCTTFAVLKHYLLLVAFMWILIDGIILLVLSTVTTFSFKLRYYLVGFTVLAYGEFKLLYSSNWSLHKLNIRMPLDCLVSSSLVQYRLYSVTIIGSSPSLIDDDYDNVMYVCILRYISNINQSGIDLCKRCDCFEFERLSVIGFSSHACTYRYSIIIHVPLSPTGISTLG